MIGFLSIPAVVALFWAVMLFFKKNRLGAHFYMAIGLAVYTVAYVLFCLLFASWSGMNVCLSYMLAAMCVPILHFLFFKKAVDVNKISKWAHVFVIVAFLIVIVLLVMTLIAGPEMSDAFYHKVVMGEDIEVPSQYSSAPLWHAMSFVTFRIFSGSLALGGIAVIVWAFIKIVRYDKLLDEYFSGRESQEKKNNMLVFLSAAFAVVPIVLLLAQPFYLIRDNSALLAVCLCLSSVAVFIVGLYSYRIEFTAEQLRFMIDEDNEKKKLADTVPANDVKASGRIYNESVTRLEKALNLDKIFLDPDLTLIGLSDLLSTNRTYLSKIINLNYNCTFSELINNMRIQYALSIIKERTAAGVSLKEVSSECGYANQASFIRNFAKLLGKTPGEWLAENNTEE